MIIIEYEKLINKTTLVMSGMYIPFVGVCNYFNLSSESLGLLSLLLLIDYFTGIAKTYVICKDEIRSYRAIAGIIAKISLLVIPVTLAIAGKQLGYNLNIIVESTINMLVLAETYSIIGNIRSIQARKNVQEIDAVSFVLSKLSRAIEGLLRKGR